LFFFSQIIWAVIIASHFYFVLRASSSTRTSGVTLTRYVLSFVMVLVVLYAPVTVSGSLPYALPALTLLFSFIAAMVVMVAITSRTRSSLHPPSPRSSPELKFLLVFCFCICFAMVRAFVTWDYFNTGNGTEYSANVLLGSPMVFSEALIAWLGAITSVAYCFCPASKVENFLECTLDDSGTESPAFQMAGAVVTTARGLPFSSNPTSPVQPVAMNMPIATVVTAVPLGTVLSSGGNAAAASASDSLADSLSKLADLHSQGILSAEEFTSAKQATISKHAN
jgi:hypothetical protein